LIYPNQEIVHIWLEAAARSDSPYLRRLVSETLRPVALNRWMNKMPEYSLSILQLLFHESHPYPRTSVGNNLSDLSRRNPDVIFSIVRELVATEDRNSYWIAYRACRNLVKSHPQKVLDLLGVDEYHYKDRNYYRS
jgi:3-methyladenine DNA glycosylase AlkC